MDEVDGRAVSEAVADLDGLVVKASTVEKGDDLVEDVGGGDEAGKTKAKGMPMVMAAW